MEEWKRKWKKRLDDLKRGRTEEEYEGEKDDLEGEEKELKKDKEKWENQVINLQNKLTDFGEGKGNEQIV